MNADKQARQQRALLALQEALRAYKQDVEEDVFGQMRDLVDCIEDVLTSNGLEIPADFVGEREDW